MKKVLFLLLVFPFVYSSCSDDDDNYSNAEIVGTWILQSSTAKEVVSNNDRATQAIKGDISSSNDDETFIFTPDGRIIVSDGKDTASGTYRLKGNKLTLDISGDRGTIDISISGNTFSADADETEYYQDQVNYLVPNEKDVVVSKVITSYTYRRI